MSIADTGSTATLADCKTVFPQHKIRESKAQRKNISYQAAGGARIKNEGEGDSEQFRLAAWLSSDAIFVAEMLSAYRVAAARPARPARLPERIILVSQIVLELLVRRELLGLKTC